MEHNFNQIIQEVLKDAHQKENNAAYNGERSDGGAHILRSQVEFFKLGLERKMPESWEKYAVKLEPDYQLYLKLQAKYGKFNK